MINIKASCRYGFRLSQYVKIFIYHALFIFGGPLTTPLIVCLTNKRYALSAGFYPTCGQNFRLLQHFFYYSQLFQGIVFQACLGLYIYEHYLTDSRQSLRGKEIIGIDRFTLCLVCTLIFSRISIIEHTISPHLEIMSSAAGDTLQRRAVDTSL